MPNIIDRRGFLFGTTLTLLGASSSIRADDLTIIPDDASPRRRLGFHLAAETFEFKGCPNILSVVGQNAIAKKEYVSTVGFQLGSIIRGIWNDDPNAVAERIENFNDLSLLTEGENEVLLMLWTLSEIVLLERGLTVGRGEQPDVKRLRSGSAALKRWVKDPRLITTLEKGINQLAKPQSTIGSGGGNDKPPPRTPPVPGGNDRPPPEEEDDFSGPLNKPIGPAGHRVPRIWDAYRVTAYELIRLMKALASEDEQKKDKPKIAPFIDDFCILLEKELRRPLRQRECDVAWILWTEHDKTIPQIANLLDQE